MFKNYSMDLAKELKESVEWLWTEKCGCSHWHLLTDTHGREWYIVLGWNDGGYEDEDNEFFYVDEGYAISYKIGYQEYNQFMATDFDLDFTMPYNEKTGEVCDTCSSISRNEDYEKLAEELLKTFKRVVTSWAEFDEESMSYLETIKE